MRGGKPALLLSLNENVAEIEELARTAGYEIVYEIVQKRARPEPNYYIGRGKVREIASLIEESPVEAVIMNGEAKPSHHYNLESALKAECLDRTRLILEIFTTRASSKESRLQVEKARLRYEMPLLKEWIHNAKGGEHPGFMGGGEYAIDLYYDLIKKRIKSIDDELLEIRKASDQKRARRERNEVFTVTLAGYTNAGKSSLMRALTGEEVLIEDRMFSTLTTTTRSLTGENVLIVDTIGFIRDLPHFMIESFRNTIDEVFYSDLILLVIDASEDIETMEQKMKVSLDILLPRVERDKMIIILNKIDNISYKNHYTNIKDMLIRTIGDSDVVLVSAKKGNGVDDLTDKINNRFQRDLLISIKLPNNKRSQPVVSKIFDLCDISKCEYSKTINITGHCHQIDVGKIRKLVSGLNGRVLEAADPAKERAPPEM
jgi:GTP-binding protein HflX